MPDMVAVRIDVIVIEETEFASCAVALDALESGASGCSLREMPRIHHHHYNHNFRTIQLARVASFCVGYHTIALLT
uniref:Uncharacterized protein n=1 Tax=Romanomermis culicivorax TaxID=13658 RepID=A0A915JSI9_ROMCU